MKINKIFPEFTVSYCPNDIFDCLNITTDGVDVWYDVHGNLCAKSKFINNKYLFNLSDFGNFLYEVDNDNLTIYPEKKENRDNINEIYYRIFLPIMIHIKGFETIHAAGIVTESGVVAFAGCSGVGKSTISYSLFKKDYGLWADDCVVVHKNADDSISTLKIPFTLRLKDSDNRNKIAYKITRSDINNSEIKNLLKIVELVKDDNPETKIDIKKLNSKDSLEVLFRHSYYCSLQNKKLKARMFNNFSHMANTLPVYSVRYPDDKTQISKLVDILDELVLH